MNFVEQRSFSNSGIILNLLSSIVHK